MQAEPRIATAAWQHDATQGRVCITVPAGAVCAGRCVPCASPPLAQHAASSCTRAVHGLCTLLLRPQLVRCSPAVAAPHLVGTAAQPHKVVVGLNVAVDEAFAVQVLDARELRREDVNLGQFKFFFSR